MLRVLLVDDEDYELTGLASMIRSFGLDLEICGTANNGYEGLCKAREHRPHIILTDLRMPQMSGIELLRALHEEGSDAKSILISGYEDFTAARVGLEFGLVAYLLKPVVREELRRVLLKCAPLPQGSPSKETFPREVPLFSLEEEQFMHRILFAPECKIEALLASQPDSGLFTAKTIFSVASLELIPADGRDVYDYLSGIRLFAKTHHYPAPVLTDSARVVLVPGAPAFVEEDSFLDKLTKEMDGLLHKLWAMNPEDLTIGLSNTETEPHKLPELYRQSVAAIGQRNCDGASRILFYDEEGSRSSERQDHQDILIERIRQIILEEYAKPLTIDCIAERLFLSPSHIRRLFKSRTGVTIMDYLESVRLDHSLSLLSRQDYKIHTIGGMVGYENPSYFNAVFKKRYGLTPGEYRHGVIGG